MESNCFHFQSIVQVLMCHTKKLIKSQHNDALYFEVAYMGLSVTADQSWLGLEVQRQSYACSAGTERAQRAPPTHFMPTDTQATKHGSESS